MTSSKTSDWLNLIAAIGVVAGLVLVAYELRQNNQLAEAETYRTMWQQADEPLRVSLELDIMPIFRRSIEDPLSLTDDEVDRLDVFLWFAIDTQIVKAVMREKYGLYEVPVEQQAEDIGSVYLRSKFGRAWYEQNERWIEPYSPSFAQAIREFLASTPIQTQYTYPEQLRDRIRHFED